MTKYSLEIKLEAVYAYLDGTESFKDIANKYRVNVMMLKQWVARFREHGVKAFQEAYTNFLFFLSHERYIIFLYFLK